LEEHVASIFTAEENAMQETSMTQITSIMLVSCLAYLFTLNMGASCPFEMPVEAGSACYLLHSGFLLCFFFYPEDGGYMFLRNFC
jgi:hypothetical protein